MVRESVMRQCADGYARSCDALAGARPADPNLDHLPDPDGDGRRGGDRAAAGGTLIGERMSGARVEIAALRPLDDDRETE